MPEQELDMDRYRGDELIRHARTAADFLGGQSGDDPSCHDAFVARLLANLCDQLEVARTVRMAGEWDDADLIRQLEEASRQADSTLHEMAALRLRTALERAKPSPPISSLGIRCEEGVEYLYFEGVDINEFRVPKFADWTKLRACIDEAERRSAEGWKVFRS